MHIYLHIFFIYITDIYTHIDVCLYTSRSLKYNKPEMEKKK